MLISTMRFGDIEVKDTQIFNFDEGLPGFPDEKKFAFLPNDDGSEDKPNFAYLQSLTTPELTFLLADPFAFFHDYEFTIDESIEALLGTSANNLPMVWSIGMVLNKIEDMTINLVAPVLFNIENQKAMQLILDGTKYKTRQRIFPENIKDEMGKEKKNMGGDDTDAGVE